MAMSEHEDHDLEMFFRAARADAPEPSEALMARVLADAEAALPPVAAADCAASTGGVGATASWVERLLGGWRAMGGLATATVAGLWIGYAGLADPSALSGGWLGGSDDVAITVDLMPEAAGVAALDVTGG